MIKTEVISVKTGGLLRGHFSQNLPLFSTLIVSIIDRRYDSKKFFYIRDFRMKD
jgi:hypothetical protein